MFKTQIKIGQQQYVLDKQPSYSNEFPRILNGKLISPQSLSQSQQQQQLDIPVIVKEIRRQQQMQMNPSFDQEIETAQKISQIFCSSLLKVLAIFPLYEQIKQAKSNEAQIIMEAPHCNLRDHILQKKIVDQTQCLHIIIQIANAVQSLQKNGLVHRDIRPESIFVLNLQQQGIFEYKLGNYGLCKQIQAFDQQKGSISYMAPEMVENKAYSEKVDIWALGVLLHELLTGVNLFPDISSIKNFKSYQELRNQTINTFQNNDPIKNSFKQITRGDIINLMENMLQVSSDQRWNIDDVINNINNCIQGKQQSGIYKKPQDKPQFQPPLNIQQQPPLNIQQQPPLNIQQQPQGAQQQHDQVPNVESEIKKLQEELEKEKQILLERKERKKQIDREIAQLDTDQDNKLRNEKESTEQRIKELLEEKKRILEELKRQKLFQIQKYYLEFSRIK